MSVQGTADERDPGRLTDARRMHSTVGRWGRCADDARVMRRRNKALGTQEFQMSPARARGGDFLWVLVGG